MANKRPEPEPFERFKKAAQAMLMLPNDEIEKIKEAVPRPKRKARRKRTAPKKRA